jgi:hypothetical protein
MYSKRSLHRPSSEIGRQGHTRGRLRQISHEQFDLFGALTLPSAEYYSDISYVAQLCARLAKAQKTRHWALGRAKGTRTWR